MIFLEAAKVKDWWTTFLLSTVVAVTFWSASVIGSDIFGPSAVIKRQELAPVERDIRVASLMVGTIDSIAARIRQRMNSLESLSVSQNHDSLTKTLLLHMREAGYDSVTVASLRVLMPANLESMMIVITERMLSMQRTMWLRVERTLSARASGRGDDALVDSARAAAELSALANSGYNSARENYRIAAAERVQVGREIYGRYLKAQVFAWLKLIGALVAAPLAWFGLVWMVLGERDEKAHVHADASG